MENTDQKFDWKTNIDEKTYVFDGSIWVQIRTYATSPEDAHKKIVRGEGELIFIDYQGLEDDAELENIREFA